MNRLAPTIVRLAALWLLAGACFKFFAGSPNDLPGPVREWPFGPDGNFKAAIAVELAVGTLALLLPRLGWWLLAGAFAVFIYVLVAVISAGEASCGCFGSSGPSPTVMLAIDATLLILMMLAKPWRIPTRDGDGKRLVTWLPLAAAGVVAPYLKFQAPAELEAVVEIDEQGQRVWSPPPEDQWPRYVTPELGDWEGMPLAETELATWFDVSLWGDDFTGIIWRRSCTHCAEHLRELAIAESQGEFALYVMIRLPGDEDQEPAVTERPQSIVADLDWNGPELVVTTPVEFTVAGGVVTSVRDDFAD